MPNNYEVTVTSPDLTINVDDSGAFSASINYEAPTKSIQHTNLILDNFSSGFDGTTTHISFELLMVFHIHHLMNSS